MIHRQGAVRACVPMNPLSTSEIITHRDQVVSALTAAAEAMGGSVRQRIGRIANHLAYVNEVQGVLGHPVLLEIYLGLRDCDSPTQAEIDEMVGQTIAKSLRRRPVGLPWWSVLLYPLLVLVICGVVTIGACLIIVPTFEHMFNDFGLRLPLPTLALVGLSHWVREPVFYLSIVLVIACVGLSGWLISGNEWPWNRHGTSIRLSGTSFPSTRQVWADWAFHLSLLLRSGQNDPDSLEIAGDASGHRWLRNGSQAWAQRIREGEQPFQNATHFRSEPCHLMSLALNPFPMERDRSMSDPATNPTHMQWRAEMLNRVAEVYWDDDRTRSQLRLGWLSPVLVILVGMIVCFVLFSLFLPLVELISGLT